MGEFSLQIINSSTLLLQLEKRYDKLKLKKGGVSPMASETETEAFYEKQTTQNRTPKVKGHAERIGHAPMRLQ